MREIKFRAWNEQIKFMGEVRNIDFINGTVEVLIEDNIGYYFEDWKKTDIKTMQYTGLQKNEKIIYRRNTYENNNPSNSIFIRIC